MTSSSNRKHRKRRILKQDIHIIRHRTGDVVSMFVPTHSHPFFVPHRGSECVEERCLHECMLSNFSRKLLCLGQMKPNGRWQWKSHSNGCNWANTTWPGSSRPLRRAPGDGNGILSPECDIRLDIGLDSRYSILGKLISDILTVRRTTITVGKSRASWATDSRSIRMEVSNVDVNWCDKIGR